MDFVDQKGVTPIKTYQSLDQISDPNSHQSDGAVSEPSPQNNQGNINLALLKESLKSGIERDSHESAVIEQGYREDFMQKTFEKQLMLQDRVTNLRRYSANINDFSKFKKMSKNFQLPDFKTSTIEKKTDLGLLDRKFSIKRDKSPNDRNLKQFYLSHHSELMATKSVSKVHRRQDRVLTKDHLDFMVSSKQIPVVSARAFKNIDINETPIKFQGHSVTNSGHQVGSRVHKNSTNASEFVKTPNLNINYQSGQSSLFKTSRSRSIVPAAQNLRTIDPSIFGIRKNTEIGSIKQLRTHFVSQEQNFGRHRLQVNNINTSSQDENVSEMNSSRFNGFQKNREGKPARKLTIPFNFSSPFIIQKNIKTANVTNDGDFYQKPITNLNLTSQNMNINVMQSDSGFGYESQIPSLGSQEATTPRIIVDKPIKFRKRASIARQLETEKSMDKIWTPSEFIDTSQQFFNQKAVIGDKDQLKVKKTTFMNKTHLNSSGNAGGRGSSLSTIHSHLQSTQIVQPTPKMEKPNKLKEIQLNPLMFRKHDESFYIHHYQDINNQLIAAKNLSLGGSQTFRSKLQPISNTTQIAPLLFDQNYSSQILSSTLGSFQIPDKNVKQALRTTDVGDPKQFTKFERNFEKSPVDIQERTVQNTRNHQIKVKQEYEDKLEEIRIREAGKIKPDPETMSQQRRRILGSNPCEELEKSEAVTTHLTKHQEKFRQFNRKMERTADAVIRIKHKIDTQLRTNINTLEWQQEHQKNKEIDEIYNIGYRDFLEVRTEYIKEDLKKRNALKLKTMLEEEQQKIDNLKLQQPQDTANSKSRLNNSPTTLKFKQKKALNLNKINISDQRMEEDTVDAYCESPLLESGRKNEQQIAAQDEQIDAFLKQARIQNDQKIEKIEQSMPEVHHVDRLQRPQDNLQIIDHKQKLVRDAKDYVSLITELFRTKVGGRRPKGLICKRVTEFLKTSSKIVDGDDNFLFEYSKEEMNDQRPAEGKLKNKISKFIDQGRQKFQELRLKEIINNSDAHIIFEEDPIFNFLKCCQSENVSCLPFIKNLASKKLVLVDFKRLTPKVWQSLTESIELFEDLQIRHIFIQSSFIDDRMFPKFLTSLEKRTELTKITLIKMTLSPIIVKTILSLIEQNPNIIEIVLVDCQIRSSIIGDSSNLDFFLEQLCKEREEPLHLQKLSLICMGLENHHLNQICQFLHKNQLKELDISWNSFTTSGLGRFLDSITTDTQLKSLNLAWNSLNKMKLSNKIVDDPQIEMMDTKTTIALNNFMKKNNKLSHIDLSNTFLAERAVHYIIKRMAKSVNIQSVHLSGVRDQMSTKTKKFIRKMLDPLDMRTTSNLSIKPECLGPPPLKKSDGHYCDTFVNDSIMDQMIYGLNRHHFKNQLISERCNHENFNDHVVGNRYVLQRILGHPEIDSYDKAGTGETVTLAQLIKFNGPNSRSFPQYNPRDQLSINKHFSRWFESHHSWYANKFRYFIPVFLKSEIKSEQKDGFNVMTDEQNRLLQRLIDNNREAFVKAKKGEPYIVGTCTSNRLMRMKKVVEFLLALDPNRVDVLEKCQNNEKRIQLHYRTSLFQMIEEYLGTKPFFDRSLAALVDQKDCMYVHNDFVQPGYHNYYIIVPNGSGGYIYKKHFLTFVKPRTEDIPHKQLPVAITEEEKPPEVQLNNSVVGKSWTFETVKNLEVMLQQDLAKWSIPKDLINTDDQDMYKQFFHDNIQYFFALYRKLAIESEMYPYIGYNDIKKFCYNLNIITSWATPMVTIGEDEEDGKTFLARLEGDQETTKKNPDSELTDSLDDDFKQDMNAAQLREMFFSTLLPGATPRELSKTLITSLEMKRNHFFELILRLSVAKYNVQIQAPENLIIFMEDFLQPFIVESEAVRDKSLIENELIKGSINELYNINLKNLTQIYDKLKQTNENKKFTLQEAIKLLKIFFGSQNLKVLENYFRRSKMTNYSTVRQISLEINQNANSLEFKEFLVLITLISKNENITSSGRQKKPHLSLFEKVAEVLKVVFEQQETFFNVPDDLTAEPAVSLSDDSNYNFDPLQPNGKKKPVRQPTKKELKKGKKEAKKEAKPAKKEAGKKGKKGKGQAKSVSPMKIVEVETEKPKSEKAPKSSEYLTRDEYDSFQEVQSMLNEIMDPDFKLNNKAAGKAITPVQKDQTIAFKLKDAAAKNTITDVYPSRVGSSSMGLRTDSYFAASGVNSK